MDSRRMRDTLMPSMAVVDEAPASLPIADYALLADCNTAALVSLGGSIDWLCLPRYDSPSLFARLLGPDAGHWAIRPAGAFAAERRYVPGTLAVETTFTTEFGRTRRSSRCSRGTLEAVRARSGCRRGSARALSDAAHRLTMGPSWLLSAAEALRLARLVIAAAARQA